MAPLPPTLRRLLAGIRAHPGWQRLHLATRLLLAMAFLPTGLVKVLGWRFTILPTEHPVGAIFEALFLTGWYWNFLGWAQVVTAVFLLVPRTAFLGAVLFLPILVNVVVLTWAVDFGLTGWITLSMLAANLFLLAWEADRIWPAMGEVLHPRPSIPGIPPMEAVGWALGAAAGMALLLATRNLAPPWWPLITGGGATVGAVLVVGAWVRQAREGPIRERRIREDRPPRR